jgi:hypothetical protein
LTVSEQFKFSIQLVSRQPGKVLNGVIRKMSCNNLNVFLNLGVPCLLKNTFKIAIVKFDNNLDSLSIFASVTTSLLCSQLKRSSFLSLLIRLSVQQTQASSLGILITFVNALYFNYLCV